MKTYNRQEAIARMNHLSTEGEAFVFVIDYTQEHSYIERVNDISPSMLLYDFNGFTNCIPRPLLSTTLPEWNAYPQSLEAYKQSFDIIRRNILEGNSFLTNLTCITHISTDVTLKEIFYRSNALYKLWIKDTFVIFSPEIFVRIHDGVIRSYPMKGTIDACIPNARQILMNDAKEAAEHATIVDLIRNDLSMVSRQVEVTRYRYIDELQTNRGNILQTSSEITGILPNDYQNHLGDVLYKLLPAGSITGAPKHKTMEVIAKAETYDRGFYTGITGYFDGKNLDSAVMIRFIEQQENGKFFFKSGGGITCKSEVNNEYNEMKQKLYVPIY